MTNMLHFSFKNWILVLVCTIFHFRASTVAGSNLPIRFSGTHTQQLFAVDDAVQDKKFLIAAIQAGNSLPAHSYSLFTHAKPGQILFDGKWYSGKPLAGLLKDLMPAKTRLLNIYGCEFAKGEEGLATVKLLEQELAVSISASDDITGKDGDWELEVGKPKNQLSFPGYNANLQYAAGDDFDGDGIINSADADDDNDGIPDLAEMTTSSSLLTPKSGVIVTTEVTYSYASGFTLQNLVDGIDLSVNGSHVIINPSGTLAGKTWLKFELPTATVLNLIELGHRISGAALFTTTSSYNIEGSNDNITFSTIEANQFYSNGAPISATTASAKFSMPSNFTAYKYYRIQGISGATAGDWAQEAYFSVLSGTDVDTDSDGISNRFDRDSDGDGCSDALEAGATSSTTANYQFSAPFGTNGLANALETSADNGILGYISTYNPNAQSAFIRVCKDSDGDGINDLADIDDDNDGVLDAMEAPTCYYSTFEAQSVSKITSQFVSSDDSQNDGDIQRLHDGTDTPTFSFNIPAGSNLTGFNIFTLQFPVPVDIASLVVSNALTNTGSGTAVVKGSNDGVNWSAALTPQTSVTTVPITFTITTSSRYKYYRIETGTTAFTLIGTLGDIISHLDANYVPGANPKSTCTTDTDGDLILNQLDLDSDGDGCSDLVETNVFPKTDVMTPSGTNHEGASYGMATPTNGQLNPAATDSNNDGFNDSVDTDLNGKNDYTSYYNTFATKNTLSGCTDSDGDGYGDLVDTDDDNDGILDIAEQPACVSTTADNCGSSRGNDSFIVWNSGTGTNLWKGTITYNGQTVDVTLSKDDNGVMGIENFTNFDNAGSGGNSFCPGFPGTHANPHLNTINTWTLSFSSPIKNPRFHLWSYGGGVNAMAPMLFDGTYTIAKISEGSGTPFTVDGTIHGIKPVGNGYAQGTIELKSELSEIVFSTTQIENFWSINVSAGNDNINSCVSFVDTDHDGIPNHLDLDSDGDGCADAIEGGGGFTTSNLVQSTMPGGNSGVGYSGVAYGVIYNLGNTVGSTSTTMGVPTIATTGQTLGTSQTAGTPCARLNSLTAVNDINETPAGVAAHGNVLSNDSDPESNTLTVNTTPVSGPSHGTVTLNANGTYTYTPTDGYTGTDSFIYQVCDNGTPQACSTATVTINIVPKVDLGNNPPVANDDTGTTPNNVPLTGKLTNNDGDPDGDPLTVNTAPITPPAHGTIVINTNGTFTYTPTTGYVGTDVIVYEVCDNGSPAKCDQATLVVIVTPPNAVNETYANDDARTGKKNTVLSGNVMDNDSDPEGNNQQTGSFKSSTGTTLTADGSTQNTLPGGGKIVIGSDGSYTYTPATGYVGTEVVTYTTCDEGSPVACAKASLYLTTLDLTTSLPVTLTDFKARRSGEGALLEWHTAAEKDFDRFELEASADAAKGYYKMAVVAGGKSAYIYTDKTLTADARYYRLKMIDTDGTFAYSRTISVSGEAGSITSSLFPNPVSGHRLYLKTSQAIDSYQVYDAAGKPVAARISSRDGDRYQITLDTHAQPGVYIVTYKVQGQTLQHKFVMGN